MRSKPHEAVQGREFLMMDRKAEWVEGANVAEKGRK